jgi:hypothetical protein
MSFRRIVNTLMLPGVAVLALAPALAHADDTTKAADATAPAETSAPEEVSTDTITVTAKATRSSTSVAGAEIQKILPGASPFKAMQTLPGVLYITADPWGNNEQNAQLFIHGFSISQLGYVMDGVPLGDQNYGNFNGLSPQRALISENVGRTVVAISAGELGIASTSNLGGAVQVYSSDPESRMGVQVNQTGGMYGTSRTYARVDSGEFAAATSSTFRQRVSAGVRGTSAAFRAAGRPMPNSSMKTTSAS